MQLCACVCCLCWDVGYNGTSLENFVSKMIKPKIKTVRFVDITESDADMYDRVLYPIHFVRFVNQTYNAQISSWINSLVSRK